MPRPQNTNKQVKMLLFPDWLDVCGPHCETFLLNQTECKETFGKYLQIVLTSKSPTSTFVSIAYAHVLLIEKTVMKSAGFAQAFVRIPSCGPY